MNNPTNSSRICGLCGQENSPHAVVCEYCGTSIPDPLRNAKIVTMMEVKTRKKPVFMF
jgi:uncharacterized membrane protein YvbJ